MGSGDLISRIYSGFRGVDFRGEEINLVRSPDSKNMWKDYKVTESISTRPKMQLMTGLSFGETINGIFFYKAADTEMMIVHSGTKLYKVVGTEKTVIYEGAKNAKSNAFVYNNMWFFQDGEHYLRYGGNKVLDVPGYVPTTSIGRKPSGDVEIEEGDNGGDASGDDERLEGYGGKVSGGTVKQDVNLLSDYRINTFSGDGTSTEYFVDSPTIDSDYTPIVTVNGKKTTAFTVDYASGKITFNKAPSAPSTSGQDNVSIRYKKAVEGAKNKILNCTLLEVFDNRVFFSGNKDYPNVIWHCSLNDPTYCADLDYYNEGLDTAKVKGMVAGNNALWVFKEPSQANTTVFYHTPTIDSEYGKIYPNTHSNISTGCIGKAINFNDDIVFFSDRGMEGISGDITTEQVISHRSSLVDRKLTVETDYADMILEEWEGYLIVIIGNKVYLADSRATFTNQNHFEYEWFYWELSKKITCARVNKGVLYLGTEDGVYTLNDISSNVESYWVTPKDKFKHPQYLKTTNKRGCTVEAKCENGAISVYTKTEKDKEFTLVGTYENVKDYFVSRIKRKKFKDIQLKFHSDTRFSLETATLECFVGGYTKR